jgi:RNA polymerase sigma-70 factor (ECF subfamily)
MEQRTNEIWLEHLQDKSPYQAEALEELRGYLKRRVLSYLYTRSDLSHLADIELQQMSEDFTQETLLKIQAKLHTFQGRSKFTTWASKIAANHASSELRRAKWRDLSLDTITAAGTSLHEILTTEDSQSSDPDISSERELVWQTITEVINNDLTDRQRRVLASVHFENIPMAEVARLLKTNVNNIYKILHDTRLKLKLRLQRLGLEPQYILSLFSESGPVNRTNFGKNMDGSFSKRILGTALLGIGARAR